jgi:hypothetical protein
MSYTNIFVQTPKVIDKVGKNDLESSGCEVYTRAYPSPRPKRQELEVIPKEIRSSIQDFFHEPLGHELLRTFPAAGVLA